MSQDDYNAGLRGDTFQQGMNQISYEAGLAKHKAGQYQGPSLPKTPVDGVGFTMLLMAPLLCLMYPVAGILTVTPTVALYLILHLTMPKLGFGWHLTAMVAAVIGCLFGFALKAEHALSHHKGYRVFRHIFRLLPVGVYWVMGLAAPVKGDVNKAGGELFFGLVLLVFLNWLFPKFDKVWFPVMDDKAKKETKKFEGKEEDEIGQAKNLEWRNKKRFFAIWLALTIGFTAVLIKTGIPFVLIPLAAWGICFALRNKFKITAPNQFESLLPLTKP